MPHVNDGLTPAERVLTRLEKYKRIRDGHWMARCPAHEDRTPSLSITERGDKLLIHCFAGCSPEDVTAAVGLELRDLFEPDPDWCTRPAFKPNGAGTHPEPDTRLLLADNAYEARATLEMLEAVETGGGTISQAGYLEGEHAARLLENAGQAVPWEPDGGWGVPGASEDASGPLPPTVGEFLDLEFPPESPILGPIRSQQLVLLYAQPGAGKTMLALNIGYHMAAGRDFLGWESAGPANVLIVDGEMAGEMMQGRMAKAGAVEPGRLRIANLPNWGAANGYEPVNLCGEEGQAVLTAWADRCSADVIILDNLMSLAWMDGVSMSSDEFWQPVKRFAIQQRSQGRTVIVVDHTNKSGGLFGTGTKVWHADLAIEMRAAEPDIATVARPTPPARFSLSFAKVRGTPQNGGTDTDDKVVEIGQVGQDWKWQSGKSENMRRAVEMSENGLTIREISEELGASKSTVGRWIKKAKRDFVPLSH